MDLTEFKELCAEYKDRLPKTVPNVVWCIDTASYNNIVLYTKTPY